MISPLPEDLPSSFVMPLIQQGSLEVRLAQSMSEITASQELRFRVFYEERGAPLPIDGSRTDASPFDPLVDHLLVIDRNDHNAVVGTYRLLRQEKSPLCGGFFSKSEYDISSLESSNLHLLELSRSCVAVPYRTLPVMNLLWRGLAEYILGWKIDILFGTASFHGNDPSLYEHALSYLHYTHLAPLPHRPHAIGPHALPLNILPQEAVDLRLAAKQMAPLMKGYLRVGGFVGEGAVVDTQFNTTDVCVMVKTDLMTRRYANYYNSRSVQSGRFQTDPA